MAARKRLQKGFTLIELLVVIGILGVLAGALFFTIDPIEQLQRGEDAKVKAAATSLASGLNIYYSSQTDYPWNTTDNCNGGALPNATAMHTTAGGVNDCITDLITNGQLRDTFDDDTATLGKLTVTDLTASDGGVAICYDPESTAESNAPETQYDADGTACTGADCYWCTF